MNKKKDILKEIMLHRQRVSLKLSAVANDIAANGRRHDNSYTGDVEYNLLKKIASDSDIDNKRHYMELLDSVHAEANDYYPEFHGGIEHMNMIQLLEYIADRIVRIDASEDRPTTIEGYQKAVINSLEPVSFDLQGVIENTVEYFLDRNKSILKSLNKQTTMDAHQPIVVEKTTNTEDIHPELKNTTGGLNYGA